jgi:nucleotide-binding universal stress UspA family protein
MGAGDTVRSVQGAGRSSLFSRVVVGVDGSAEAAEAVRQAAVLAEDALTLLAVYDIAPRIVGGTGATVPAYFDEDQERQKAEGAVERVRDVGEAVKPVGKVVRGRSSEELIREIEREEATLAAVGSHGIGRARGIVVGSTATELVHKAPCSVLVAREAGEQFPTRIVAGVDGSAESAAAFAAARDLADRFGADLRSVVARRGKEADEKLVARIVEQHESSPDEPVGALVAATGDADLLVVGSRGLSGLKSLGSVSERVAHQAGCSVLIVREAPWQRVDRALGDEPPR